MKYDILIIGAGAAGLMAMKELLHTGYRVCLLEAAPSPGGRIATIKEKGFTTAVETGAEFIHGKLPLTLKILRKAGIKYEAVRGQMISVQKDQWNKGEEHDGHWDELLQKLRQQKKDSTIKAFVQEHFPGKKYKGLRDAVKHFAEGFDLADINKASILSVKKEWEHEQHIQYRIPGGYCQLTDHVLHECRAMNGTIYFNACARAINYGKGNVTVTTRDRRKFEATKIIITVSAGVLQSGDLVFRPGLGAHQTAIRQIGFGSVIKILLQFKIPFWKDKADDIGFLLSDEIIPTWWTQLPSENNLLTGWLGGPVAAKRANDKNATLLKDALVSLSSIFKIDAAILKKQLVQYNITSWHNEPFVHGGYSYNTLFTEKAIDILNEPVEGTVFFAGEAVHTGEAQGTVEAALQTGLAVAKKIRKMDK